MTASLLFAWWHLFHCIYFDTVIYTVCRNFIAQWRHLLKTQLLLDNNHLSSRYFTQYPLLLVYIKTEKQ